MFSINTFHFLSFTFRFVREFCATYQFILLVFLVWSNATICSTLLMIQMEMVKWFTHWNLLFFLSYFSKISVATHNKSDDSYVFDLCRILVVCICIVLLWAWSKGDQRLWRGSWYDCWISMVCISVENTATLTGDVECYKTASSHWKFWKLLMYSRDF